MFRLEFRLKNLQDTGFQDFKIPGTLVGESSGHRISRVQCSQDSCWIILEFQNFKV